MSPNAIVEQHGVPRNELPRKTPHHHHHHHHHLLRQIRHFNMTR
jgi:hypothetical protein